MSALPAAAAWNTGLTYSASGSPMKHLLGEADGQQHQAAREALGRVGAPIGPLVELVHDLAPAHQRAGENLRKEADVEGVADEIVARRPAGLEIRQVHDVVEGEERDAERQRDVELRRLQARNAVQRDRRRS